MNEKTSRSEEDHSPDTLLDIAEKQVAWALEVLDQAVSALVAQEGDNKSITEAANGMRKAIQTLFNERHVFEKLHGTDADEDGIDLDAVRIELGRRLDRLREQRNTGRISEEPE